MWKSPLPLGLAVVFSLAATLISYHLLMKHMTGAAGPAWFDAGCSDDPDSTSNCGKVLASRYSYFPPRDPESKELRGVPVALLGLMYYSGLTLWWLAIGTPDRNRRWIHGLPLAVMAIGLIGSAGYVYIMMTVLETWCPWCLVTHVLNGLIFGCALLMGLAKKSTPPATVPHPSRRLTIVTAIAVLLLASGEMQLYGRLAALGVARANKIGLQRCAQAVNELKADVKRLVGNWRTADPVEIPPREDDPRRMPATDGGVGLSVVVFSDFECPSCGRFTRFLEQKAQPLFDGHLSVVFKHHPIDQACNPRASKTMHPHACQAARIAEAARLIGGNDAFWAAHDYLFAHQEETATGQLAAEAVAARIGLDAGLLKSATASSEVRDRIQADIAAAKKCNVRGTPSVFVERRPVHPLAVSEVGFWDGIATLYWKRIQKDRPERATLQAVEATPDSQDQKDAPSPP